MPRLLVLSNGHGEDSIGGQLIDCLQQAGARDVAIEAWPMVGVGAAYTSRGIPVCGSPNLLPSQGFATLSFPLLLRDIRAGWLGTHVRQVLSARALRGRFDLALAVGDVVATTAAVLAHLPFVFVGCAKSEYYGRGYGYTRFELAQLRRHCLVAFPRDARTARALAMAGVSTRYVGNPMMDGLEKTNAFEIERERIVIGCLPGSRSDAIDNAVSMLRILTSLRAVAPQNTSFHALFAAGPGFDAGELRARVTAVRDWHAVSPIPALSGSALRLSGGMGLDADVITDRFVDVLHHADIVLGTAGTANEQAIGLGKPLVTFATDGPQGRAYLAMKMRYLGDSALQVCRDPARAAATMLDLLGDSERQAKMAAAGRERMGLPGASAAIAATILAALDAPRTTVQRQRVEA